MDDRRTAQYERILEQLRGLIEGASPSLTAAMATICAVLHAKMPHHFWTGFYFVAGADELHIGPYQGPLACQILKGKGVCLRATASGVPIVVSDVDAFPGHIACDARSKSEIAVPLKAGDRVVAVFDVDSNESGQFTDEDVPPLTHILSLLAPLLEPLGR